MNPLSSRNAEVKTPLGPPPEIPGDLLEWIDRTFPDREQVEDDPSKVNLNKILMDMGRRKFIRTLQEHYRRQQEARSKGSQNVSG